MTMRKRGAETYEMKKKKTKNSQTRNLFGNDQPYRSANLYDSETVYLQFCLECVPYSRARFVISAAVDVCAHCL